MTAGTPIDIGPWILGMVNTVDDHSLPPEALWDALDCDIDREGVVRSRHAYDLLSDAGSFADMFELNGVAYAVSQGAVGVLGTASFDTIRAVNGPVGWTEVHGQPVFCDYDGVYVIDGQSASQLEMHTVIDTEKECRYGFTNMPGGRDVAYWHGRLLVLRGRSLLWSEALDYGTHSPTRNFVRFPSNPIWMAPVEHGVYVGLRDSVVFLSGTDPGMFSQRTVAGASSPGAALVIPNHYLAAEARGQGDVAVWFGATGFVVGHADGSVVYPQTANIRGLTVVPRKLAIIDERVYAFTTEE